MLLEDLMRRWSLVFFLLVAACGYGQTKYILKPHITFILNGNPFSGRPFTGSCDATRFKSFDIYKEDDIEYLHLFGKVYKTGGWIQGYKFIQGENCISSHQPLFNMGVFLSSMKDFELEDADGNSIGSISGNFFH